MTGDADKNFFWNRGKKNFKKKVLIFWEDKKSYYLCRPDKMNSCVGLVEEGKLRGMASGKILEKQGEQQMGQH